MFPECAENNHSMPDSPPKTGWTLASSNTNVLKRLQGGGMTNKMKGDRKNSDKHYQQS